MFERLSKSIAQRMVEKEVSQRPNSRRPGMGGHQFQELTLEDTIKAEAISKQNLAETKIKAKALEKITEDSIKKALDGIDLEAFIAAEIRIHVVNYIKQKSKTIANSAMYNLTNNTRVKKSITDYVISTIEKAFEVKSQDMLDLESLE